jgi:dephospho-CoA kinase
VGSGKSTVAQRLVDHGAVLIDADRIARAVVEPGTPGFEQVHAAFGDEILGHDGSLDRHALAALVFRDPEARATLEGIVHPLVRQQAEVMTAAAPEDAVVVHDVPLLIETGRANDYDVVVVVDAPESMRIQRLRAAKGWDAATSQARMDAQVGRDERLSHADEILVNDGDLQALMVDVDALWERLSDRARTVQA